MSAKHTPGPWEVVALNGFGPFAIRMATPAGTGHPTHYGVGQIGTEANARLIAAAPDMIETLKYVHEELVQLGYEETSFLDRVSAAISKAEAT